mmetsp:Transcript_17902/g.38703  ORF Transcript_17902/g.38703 Transcript_17902/m.38703 type:complete len:85 (-) Transcript_17902:194-448(-)
MDGTAEGQKIDCISIASELWRWNQKKVRKRSTPQAYYLCLCKDCDDGRSLDILNPQNPTSAECRVSFTMIAQQLHDREQSCERK